MHFAANIEVSEGQSAPLSFWNNNVAGVFALVEAMMAAQIHHLVFSSTCAVYGEPQKLPISEDEPRTPVNVYGRTKHVVELLLEDMPSLGVLKYAALRYFMQRARARMARSAKSMTLKPISFPMRSRPPQA